MIPATISPICACISGSPPATETTRGLQSSTARRHSSPLRRLSRIGAYSRKRPPPRPAPPPPPPPPPPPRRPSTVRLRPHRLQRTQHDRHVGVAQLRLRVDAAQLCRRGALRASEGVDHGQRLLSVADIGGGERFCPVFRPPPPPPLVA